MAKMTITLNFKGQNYTLMINPLNTFPTKLSSSPPFNTKSLRIFF